MGPKTEWIVIRAGNGDRVERDASKGTQFVKKRQTLFFIETEADKNLTVYFQ